MTALVVSAIFLLLASVGPLSGAEFSARRIGEQIVVDGPWPPGADSVELHIRSRRNSSVSRLSDISPDDPNPPAAEPGKEIWFPVVDVALESGMKAVARFSGVAPGDRYCANGNVQPETLPLQAELSIEQPIEHWENAIYVESASARLDEFYLAWRLSRPGRSGIDAHLRPLGAGWSGTIEVHAMTAGGATRRVAVLEVTPESSIASGNREMAEKLNRAELVEAIDETVALLLRSRNRNPVSPTHGGLYLFYDTDAGTWRRPDWIWTWGPAIRFLIKAGEIPEIAARYGRERLLRVAREIGEAALRFVVTEPEHPARGLIITRYDPRTSFEGGFSAFSSPADAYFLAGWGWVPLYEATLDQRFLEASRQMLDQTDRLLAQDDVIEQDFVFGPAKWKNWTMDESGFGMEGFAEVYRSTREKRYQTLGRRYIKSLLAVLERDDGLWDRVWHRNDPARTDDVWPGHEPRGVPFRAPVSYTTRGQSWAMIGLLATHRLLPEEGYLEKAKRLAEHLMRAQRPEGHWTFNYDSPASEVGISEKGTAIWSVLFYRLYRETRDPRHLHAARQALRWCLAARVNGSDPEASSGIIGQTRASGVVYRRWYPLICTYTMSFYGNALLEELAGDF